MELNTLEIKLGNESFTVKATFKMLASIERLAGKSHAEIAGDIVKGQSISYERLAAYYNTVLNSHEKRVSASEIEEGIVLMGSAKATAQLMNVIRVGFAGSESLEDNEEKKS